MALSKEWTDHIKDPEKKVDFDKYIRNSGALLDRLTDIIQRRLYELQSKEDRDDFSSPAWAYHTAYRQGYRKALNEIRKLIDRSE